MEYLCDKLEKILVSSWMTDASLVHPQLPSRRTSILGLIASLEPVGDWRACKKGNKLDIAVAATANFGIIRPEHLKNMKYYVIVKYSGPLVQRSGYGRTGMALGAVQRIWWLMD